MDMQGTFFHIHFFQKIRDVFFRIYIFLQRQTTQKKMYVALHTFFSKGVEKLFLFEKKCM